MVREREAWGCRPIREVVELHRTRRMWMYMQYQLSEQYRAQHTPKSLEFYTFLSCNPEWSGERMNIPRSRHSASGTERREESLAMNGDLSILHSMSVKSDDKLMSRRPRSESGTVPCRGFFCRADASSLQQQRTSVRHGGWSILPTGSSSRAQRGWALRILSPS